MAVEATVTTAVEVEAGKELGAGEGPRRSAGEMHGAVVSRPRAASRGGVADGRIWLAWPAVVDVGTVRGGVAGGKIGLA